MRTALNWNPFRTKTFRKEIAAGLACGLLLALFVFRMVTTIPSNSVTYDEPAHVTRGYALLRYHDTRLNIDHPVLGDALVALPLLFDRSVQFPINSEAWKLARHWVLADEFLWHRNPNPQALVNRARYSVVVMSALLAMIVGLWAAELYGAWAAVLAMLCFTFSPTVIANSIVATNDLALALFSTIYLFALWNFCRRPGPARGILTAVFLAGAAMCKYSGLILIVDTVLLIAAWTYRPLPSVSHRDWSEPESPGHILPSRSDRGGSTGSPDRWSATQAVRAGAALLIGSALLVWMAYGLRLAPIATQAIMKQEVGETFDEFIREHAPRGDDRLIKEPGEVVEKPAPPPRNLRWQALNRVPVPAPQYVRGLLQNILQARGGHRAYLLGKVSRTGWWYYFPVAFGVKTPIPFLLLIGASLCALGWFRKDGELFLGIPVCVLLAAAMKTHMDIGIRHLLPIYPLLAVFCGRLAPAITILNARLRRSTTVGAAVCLSLLCTWYGAEGARIHPLYLTYFNQFAGGPSGGYRFLADSNLDWGQDLIRLACELNRRHLQNPMGFAYFGTAEPQAYGIDDLPLDPTPAHTRVAGRLPFYGWVAVSESDLAYFGRPGGGLQWLVARKPAFVVGHTIRVYHIPFPRVQSSAVKDTIRTEQQKKVHADQVLE